MRLRPTSAGPKVSGEEEGESPLAVLERGGSMREFIKARRGSFTPMERTVSTPTRRPSSSTRPSSRGGMRPSSPDTQALGIVEDDEESEWGEVPDGVAAATDDAQEDEQAGSDEEHHGLTPQPAWVDSEGLDGDLEVHIAKLGGAVAADWPAKKASILALSKLPRPWTAHTVRGRPGVLNGDREVMQWSRRRASHMLEAMLHDRNARVREFSVARMSQAYARGVVGGRFGEDRVQVVAWLCDKLEDDDVGVRVRACRGCVNNVDRGDGAMVRRLLACLGSVEAAVRQAASEVLPLVAWGDGRGVFEAVSAMAADDEWRERVRGLKCMRLMASSGAWLSAEGEGRVKMGCLEVAFRLLEDERVAEVGAP